MLDASGFDPFSLQAFGECETVSQPDRQSQAGISAGEARAPGFDLGKKGKYPVPAAPAFEGWWEEAEESNWELRRVVAELFPDSKVATCGQFTGRTVVGPGGLPGVMIRRAEERYYRSNVTTCHLTHICPHCGDIRAEQKRIHLANAMTDWVVVQKGRLGFMTLTQGHARTDKLEESLDLLKKRFEKVFRPGGKQNKAMESKFGFVGGWRNVETTFSFINGWHPHYHCPLMFKQGTTDEQIEAFQTYARTRWIEETRNDARKANDRAFDFRNIDHVYDIAGYLQKSGLAAEATKGNISKKGRKESRSMRQVLVDYARWNFPADGLVYQEFGAVMHDKKQCVPFGLARKLYPQSKFAENHLDQLMEMKNVKPVDVCFIEAEVHDAICRAGNAHLIEQAVKQNGIPGLIALAQAHGFGVQHGVHPPEAAEWVHRSQKFSRKE